jgi:menaquinone-dependent protoporphyrinogen oxidase
VRHHRAVLADRPLWLFSSGPLGTETTDAQGQDLRLAAEPEEFEAVEEAAHPRGRRVFFGALDPETLGLRDRLIRALPAGRALLPEGDFRDWTEIEAWARGIAEELARMPAASG